MIDTFRFHSILIRYKKNPRNLCLHISGHLQSCHSSENSESSSVSSRPLACPESVPKVLSRTGLFKIARHCEGAKRSLPPGTFSLGLQQGGNLKHCHPLVGAIPRGCPSVCNTHHTSHNTKYRAATVIYAIGMEWSLSFP